MKAIVIKKYGTNEVLEYSENTPVPTFGNNEVLIKMRFASVNPIDWKVMQGKAKLLLKYKLPLVMGNDGSGVIEEVGSGVTKFKKGDQVYFRPSKGRIGTFAEYFVIQEDEVALKPKTLSLEQTASIPLVGLTSYQAMIEKGKLHSGQSILIQAGSGGVGTFAIQFAKAKGFRVAATTSTPNVEFVKSLGADLVIDYKKENFWEISEKFDMVFDTLGGENLIKSFDAAKKGGIVVSIASVPTPDVGERYGVNVIIKTLLYLMNAKLRSLSSRTGVRYEFLMMNASGVQLSEIAEMIDAGKIKPVIDKIFLLKDTKDAFAYQQTGRAKGKILIKID